ncbi:hypothetical protein M2447_002363 [Ereboglobus sp. PH5-10]|uniref:hypothetical protein n=1 Tax=Ereboglobus sp. PH5-10 TaxID=2940629 RepID=UPI002404D7AA|nr:hypothetical protein [Ereboglobus sp. PH5-10]MDF9828245.1 hypothetical protein [Ereboglobus sp. PH5-10]
MSKASIRQPLIISFTYDYANRRVGKRVQEKTGGQWRERYHHLYVYNGSQPVAEIDASTRRVLRTFAWGATGELLMIHDRTNTASPQTYLPVRDASGSVTALVRDDGNSTTIVAVYEYDPNGNLLRAQGEYAKNNPFTFGGGWMDWETGLINGGPVYYAPRLGRMINTAPSGSGDGMVACYGVAPTYDRRPERQYARAPARRISAEYLVAAAEYKLALAAQQKALAEHEAATIARDGYLSLYPDDEPPEENLASEFIANDDFSYGNLYIEDPELDYWNYYFNGDNSDKS